jgi:Protein of unknown function (DUF3154).
MIDKILDLDFAGKVVSPITNMIDNLTTTTEEKQKLRNELQKIQNEMTAKYVELEAKTIDAKRDVMVEELKQDDKYTKRARPTVIYAGLMILFINHVVLPWIAFFLPGTAIPTINLPTEFWLAWGGVCGVYAFGRTQEKMKNVK